jgi:hypothetical protein
MSFTISIDVLKIDKSLLKEVTKKDGTKAVFLNLICWPNEDGKDQYDNDGTVKQSLSKEQRDAGTKVKILGNYKVKGDAPAPKAERVVQHSPIETDDIPF